MLTWLAELAGSAWLAELAGLGLVAAVRLGLDLVAAWAGLGLGWLSWAGRLEAWLR